MNRQPRISIRRNELAAETNNEMDVFQAAKFNLVLVDDDHDDSDYFLPDLFLLLCSGCYRYFFTALS